MDVLCMKSNLYKHLKSVPRTTISGNIESLHAFHFTLPDIEKTYGWDQYDTQTEYLRMGVPNPQWVLTRINREFEVITKYFVLC